MENLQTEISVGWKDGDLLNSQTEKENIGKSVVDQRKGDIMQKELLSPVERLEDETGDSGITKVDNN